MSVKANSAPDVMTAIVRADASTVEKSFEDIYFDRMEEAIQRCGAQGYLIIRGVERDDDNDDDDDAGNDGEDEETQESKSPENEPKANKSLSEGAFDCFRVVLMTKARVAEIDKADDFVTCGQVGDWMQMYNTHSGNMVIEGIPNKINSAMRRKTLPARFDSLFALTYCLHDTDCWLFDNECGGEGEECDKAIQKLARAWKKLLAHSDAELVKYYTIITLS